MKIINRLIEPLVKLWEVKDEIPEKVDVIVGIGTGLKSDGTCSPQSDSITRRCIFFYNKGIASSSKIIFSSGNSWGGPREAEAMITLAVKLGVPEKDIIVEVDSKNTRENAIETQAVLARELYPDDPWKNILIVTYRIHARKVKACFKKVFEGSYPKDYFRIYIAKAYSDHDPTVPQKRLRSKIRFFLWELATYTLFKLKGWI